MPEDLRGIDNFARQLLNSRLMGVVPEAHTRWTNGWHGTRQRLGRWLAMVGIPPRPHSKSRSQILRDVGWRPLQLSPGPRLRRPCLSACWPGSNGKSQIARIFARLCPAEGHGGPAFETAKEQIYPRLTDYVRKLQREYGYPLRAVCSWEAQQARPEQSSKVARTR
jgi:hypothetical protein